MRRQLLPLLCVLAAFAFSTATAVASITTYSDYASWSANVENITNVAIPDPAPEPFLLIAFYDASVTYSGVTFSSQAALSDKALFNIGLGWSGSPAVLSSQGGSWGVANILITFPEVVHGFCLNNGYGTFNGSDVTFTLSNGDAVTQASTPSGYATTNFIGITDPTGFTSVQLTSPDYVLDINNIAYATVPEPATFIIWSILGGLGLTVGWWRKRKQVV
jgi:hypothetical protein